MNVITGLPRSGSTLLCNVLNQNPDIHASSTSILAPMIKAISDSASNLPETTSCLINEKGFYAKLHDSIKAFSSTWHPDKTVFDKGRLWSSMGLIYKDLYPEGLMVVMVRDLRDVFASMEKQHRKTPLLHNENMVSSEGLFERADMVFSPTGMVGGCVAGIEDLIRRQLNNVLFIKYEIFVNNPAGTLKAIYEYLGTEFTHNLDNVKNVSTDVDELYHNKYPHKGEGKIDAKNIGMWDKYISKDLAQLIKGKFPLYAETFGYD